MAVANTGAVSVQTGTLEFSGGGASTAGTFTVASGAALDFGGGTFTLSGGSYNASGTTEISGGTTNFTGAKITSLGALDVASGTLALGSSSGAAASLTQTGGVISGTGTLTVSGAATFSTTYDEQTGTGTTLLDGVTSAESGEIALDGGRLLENAGTFNVTGSAYFLLGYNPYTGSVGNGTIENDKGATFDFETASTIYNETGTNAFVNAGTLEQTVFPGTTNIEVTFTNTGTVSVQSGTLEFSGGGTSTAGTFTVASGAALDFGSGTFTLSGGSYDASGTTEISGGATNFTGATITSLGALDVICGTLALGSSSGTAASLTQTGGIISGTGTLTVSGAATFSSGNDEQTGTGTTLLDGVTSMYNSNIGLDGGRVLENAGTFNVIVSGAFYLGDNFYGTTLGGSTIKNDKGATFDFETASEINNEQGVNAFVNAGTLEQTVTTGTTNIGVTVTNTGTVSVKTGMLEFSGGGSSSAGAFTVASGATLDFGGGAFTLSGGTIGGAGVTQVSAGTLTTATNLTIASSFTQTGGTITGSNELTISGAATFIGTDEQTGTGTTLLDGVTSMYNSNIGLDGGRVLENAGTFNVIASANFYLGYNFYGTTLGGSTIKNDKGATFDFETASGITNEQGANAFVNAGTLEQTVTPGTTTIGVTITNTGTVSVQTGTLEFNAGGTSTAGKFTVASGATLDFAGGTFTLSGGSYDASGTTEISGGTTNFTGATITSLGALDVTGGTLALGSSSGAAASLTQTGGVISGTGTLTVSGAATFSTTYDEQTGTGTTLLDGVTSAESGAIALDGGRLLENAGTFNVTGSAYFLLGYNPYTGSVGNGTIKNDKGATFDFETASTIYNETGTNAFVNAGTLEQTVTPGTTNIEVTVTNTGTVSVQSGTLEFSGDLTNLAGTTLTGGAYSIGAGSVLELANNATIATDDANITLSGAGSTIQSYDTTTGDQVSFDSTILTIGATGQLHLLAGRSLTTAAAPISDDGLVQLGGGTLTVTGAGSSLTIGAGANLLGFGVINATTLTNSGLIEASGGTLTVQNAVAGKGGVQIDAKATLVLGGSTASGSTATFNGAGATLTLDKPASFASTTGGIGLDDTFDLVGVTANAAKVNGSNQLVVTENGTTVDTLQLSGNNSGFDFVTKAVAGGTDVISLPVPATVADYLDVPADYDLIAGGFAISDTAANVSANLGKLNDSHITSITATSGPVSVFVSTFSADQSTLDKIVGGFAISDTASNISAGLNSLSDPDINSITISDNGAIGVNVAQLTSDATAIGKLANANAQPYQLAVTDSLPNIIGDLSALNGNSHIASLDATSGAATLSSVATIAAPTFTLTGSTTALTLSEILSYSGSLGADAGATVSVSSGDSLTLTGTDAFSSATISGAGTLVTNGTTTVSGTSVISPNVTNNGTVLVSSGTLDLTGAVTGKGTDTISDASTLEFGAGVSTATTVGDQNIGFTGGGTLDLLAPTSFYGEISGFGTGDTVDLLGSWKFSKISEAGGVTTLTLASGSTKHGFEFSGGSYAESNFSITSGTTTTIKFAA